VMVVGGSGAVSLGAEACEGQTSWRNAVSGRARGCKAVVEMWVLLLAAFAEHKAHLARDMTPSPSTLCPPTTLQSLFLTHHSNFDAAASQIWPTHHKLASPQCAQFALGVFALTRRRVSMYVVQPIAAAVSD
jgi:hypothetical protein